LQLTVGSEAVSRQFVAKPLPVGSSLETAQQGIRLEAAELLEAHTIINYLAFHSLLPKGRFGSK